MRRQDFTFELPDALIAREPPAERRGSRLMCLDGATGDIAHRQFSDLLSLVAPGDLMVFNNTRVIPARVFGQKASGGKIEILVERILSERVALAHIKSSRSPRPESMLMLEDGSGVKVLRRQGPLFELQFTGSVLAILDAIGHMPLPPYIDREDNADDRERYQTVYAQRPGAVAAPTAGLHFDEAMLEQLREKGVEIGFVTLHVGAGTFQPVRVDDIEQHQMHSEYMEVSAEICAKVKQTKAAGRRVIAVGTTSVRCLESAAQQGEIQPYTGETNIFIYPSYRYRVVDALITNFHLPESTLLMLVSAFAGFRQTIAAYRTAVDEGYRFFSYGDAMFITHNDTPSLPDT